MERGGDWGEEERVTAGEAGRPTRRPRVAEGTRREVLCNQCRGRGPRGAGACACLRVCVCCVCGGSNPVTQHQQAMRSSARRHSGGKHRRNKQGCAASRLPQRGAWGTGFPYRARWLWRHCVGTKYGSILSSPGAEAGRGALGRWKRVGEASEPTLRIESGVSRGGLGLGRWDTGAHSATADVGSMYVCNGHQRLAEGTNMGS